MNTPRRKLKAGRFAALAGDFWRNPDRYKLSFAAQALYCAALSYAAESQSDGEVPYFIIPALLAQHTTGISTGSTTPNTTDVTGELTECGWWAETAGGFKAIGWEKYNLTKDEIANVSERQRANVAKRWNTTRNTTGISTGSTPSTLYPHRELTSPDGEVSVGSPTVGDQLRKLESRYDSELIAEARKSCALSRRNGKLADSVWLRVLEQLSAHPKNAVESSIRIFVEKHADGEKNEQYLIGIVRGEVKRANGTGPQKAKPFFDTYDWDNDPHKAP